MEEFDHSKWLNADVNGAGGDKFDHASYLNAEEEITPLKDNSKSMGDWNEGDYDKDSEWSQMMRKRDYNTMVTARDELSGEIGDWEAAWQNVTQAIGKGVDTAEHFVISPVLNTIGEASSELGGALANSVNAGQGAVDFDNKQMNAVREGVQAELKPIAKWYMGLDRNTRKNIDGVGLLAAIMPVNRVVSSVKNVTSDSLRVTGNVLRNSLDKQTRKASVEMIDVPPNMLTKVEKKLRVDKMDDKGKVVPDADDISEMKAVESLEDFSPVHGKLGGDASVHRRYNVIKDGVKIKSKELNKVLDEDGSIVKMSSVQDSIDMSIDKKMAENRVAFSDQLSEIGKGENNIDTISKISDALRTQAKHSIDEAVKLSKNNTLDSRSLHDARKIFDKAITKGKESWGDDYKIKDVLQKAVRNGINDVVDKSTSNPSIAGRRNQVMHLIKAKDKANLVVQEHKIINPLREGFKVISGVGRTQYLGQILASAAGSVGLAGAAGLIKGGIATTAIAGGMGFGIVYLGGRVLMTRKARAGLLVMVKALNKVITSSPDAARKIAARKSKVAIIDLIAKGSAISKEDEE